MNRLLAIPVALLLAAPAALATPDTTEAESTGLRILTMNGITFADSEPEHRCSYDLLTGACDTGTHAAGTLWDIGFLIGHGPVRGDYQVLARSTEGPGVDGITCSINQIQQFEAFCTFFHLWGGIPAGEEYTHECYAAQYYSMRHDQAADEGSAGFVNLPDDMGCVVIHR